MHYQNKIPSKPVTPRTEAHRVLPAELLNVPAGHGEHVEEPALALKVPDARRPA